MYSNVKIIYIYIYIYIYKRRTYTSCARAWALTQKAKTTTTVCQHGSLFGLAFCFLFLRLLNHMIEYWGGDGRRGATSEI